jgi:hypothetical protein
MNTRATQELLFASAALAGALAVFAATAVAEDAQGKVLDAKAVKSLVSGRMWQARGTSGGGDIYWSWKSDGSVCVRQNERTGKCLDTGTWKLKDHRVCYETTWFGASVGMSSRCFRVVDKGKGRYGELEESGIATIEFWVVK